MVHYRFGSSEWGVVAFVLLASGLGSVGCSSDDEHPPGLRSSEVAAEWCAALCSWRQGCGLEGQANSCAVDCRYGGVRSSIRPEFYREMAACLNANLDCPGGTDDSWEACYVEAVERVPLSQAAFDFCESMGPIFFECGYGMSPTSCARSYISFTDDVLETLHVCSNATCDDFVDCIDSTGSGK